MTTTALVGSTGLVGSQILSALLNLSPTPPEIHSLSRRAPQASSFSTQPNLHIHANPETSSWASTLSSISPAPSIFFSALGTTRGAAGSVAAQRLIDYDLNLQLAQTAAKAGTKVYVLISTSGANAGSMLPYAKMKGELDEAVQKIEGFETVVILRPGLLLGTREQSRPAEYVVRKIAGGMNALVGNKATDFWAQDVEIVGRAAVAAGMQALEGGKGKVWMLGQADVVRLGRTEWKA